MPAINRYLWFPGRDGDAIYVAILQLRRDEWSYVDSHLHAVLLRGIHRNPNNEFPKMIGPTPKRKYPKIATKMHAGKKHSPQTDWFGWIGDALRRGLEIRHAASA